MLHMAEHEKKLLFQKLVIWPHRP